jgi:hypothetical protein
VSQPNECRKCENLGATYQAKLAAIELSSARRRRTRSSIGGCVEKSLETLADHVGVTARAPRYAGVRPYASTSSSGSGRSSAIELDGCGRLGGPTGTSAGSSSLQSGGGSAPGPPRPTSRLILVQALRRQERPLLRLDLIGDPFELTRANRDELECDLEVGHLGMLGQPGLGGPPQAAPLLRTNHLQRIAETVSALGLHLAEDEPAAASKHDVELVAGGARVRRQYAVPTQAVVQTCAPLSGTTRRGRALPAPTQPASAASTRCAASSAER